MKLKTYLILVTIWVFFCSTTIAQEDTLINDPPDFSQNDYPEPQETLEVLSLPLSRLEFQLSLFVLGFGVMIILLEIFLIKANKISPEEAVKFILVTIIIVSTLFLITAGYSNDQIAPAVGLLGTIAGYLLGKASQNQKNEN